MYSKGAESRAAGWVAKTFIIIMKTYEICKVKKKVLELNFCALLCCFLPAPWLVCADDEEAENATVERAAAATAPFARVASCDAS